MKEKVIDTCLIVATFLAALISYSGIEDSLRTKRVNYSFWVFCILILVLIVLTWVFYFVGKPKSYNNKDKTKINNYLERLYSKTGHCYIFSRGSMTWFTHGTIKESLKKKCREGQLTIVVPKENDYTNELKQCGGIVFTCEELNVQNFASWSIINPEGTDCIIALGSDVSNKHYISEYSVKHKDFVNTAKLITRLLDILAKKR